MTDYSLLQVDTELQRYAEAAELIYPGLGKWTYEKFAVLNHRHFFDTLPVVPIQWHWTLAYGHALGLAGVDIIKLGIYRNQGLMKPGLYAEHVLLHEMLHHYLQHRGENIRHNGEPWCREIMRLGGELGIKPFVAEPPKVGKQKLEGGGRKSIRQQGGDLGMKQIASFPHFAFDYETGQVKAEYCLSVVTSRQRKEVRHG